MADDDHKSSNPESDVEATSESELAQDQNRTASPETSTVPIADDMEMAADSLAADLERLRGELDEAKNRALRSSAELENYRKRANRQIDEERRYANIDLIRDLLPVWDNMARAVEAAEKADQTDPLLEGFRMVHQQFGSALERNHCLPIKALHQPFDPHLHEAISQLPSEEYPAGTVLHVTQIGFQLHDRVVRPCQVVVSTGSPDTGSSAENPGED